MPYTCPKKGTMVYKITSDSQAVSITKNGNTVASFTNTGGGAKTGNFSVNKGDILSYSLGDRSGHINGIGIILAYN